MKIIVDTSVWIEFFNPKPKLSREKILLLASLIRETEVAIIEPIRAEIFSGTIAPSNRLELTRYFDALNYVDLDWNAKDTWNQIIEFASIAKTRHLKVPGIVDRMILLSAKHAKLELWTLDQSLSQLAKMLHMPVWQPPKP